MAPRKRRGRSSSTPAQQSAPQGSTSNSAATSSHSSPLALKSDQDTPASGSTPTERNPSDPVLPSKNGQNKDSQALGKRIRSKTNRSGAPSATTGSLASREPSVSAERTAGDGDPPIGGREKDRSRAQFLIETYREATANTVPEEHFTVADIAVHLYNNMINWAVTDVAVQFKRNIFLKAEAARRRAVLESLRSKDSSPPPVPKAASKLLYSDKNVTVECSNCGSNISASRYAQHLEKCLGRGGRMSSRAASARLRASAERAEKEAAADMDDHPVRRRRHSSVDASADGGFNGGGSYSKRRKMSPVPSGGSAAGSQVGSLQHGRAGLPPSGRTRASPP